MSIKPQGGSISGASTPTRGLTGVIHTARKLANTVKASSRVLIVNSTFDSKGEEPVFKRRHWEVERIDLSGEEMKGIV